MSLEESARAVLSGEYERRRGYLSNTITTWNRLAVTATFAIWGFFVRWEAVAKEHPDWRLFATQVAWAGALSSIFIGLWRLYVHLLDHAIVRLYPGIYLCERVLLPKEVCTIDSLKCTQPISRADIARGVVYTKVHERDFGGRGHGVTDLIGSLVIFASGVASIVIGVSHKIITLSLFGKLHWIGLLLIGNGIGLVLIVFAHFRWRNCEHSWPIPSTCTQQGENV